MTEFIEALLPPLTGPGGSLRTLGDSTAEWLAEHELVFVGGALVTGIALFVLALWWLSVWARKASSGF